MAKNERTSKRVAAIAARIVARSKTFKPSNEPHAATFIEHCMHGMNGDDLVKLAASALTQSPDRPAKRKKVKRNGN